MEFYSCTKALQSKSVVSFIVSDDARKKENISGIITHIQRFGERTDDALLRIDTHQFGVYLRNITSMSTDCPILLNNISKEMRSFFVTPRKQFKQVFDTKNPKRGPFFMEKKNEVLSLPIVSEFTLTMKFDEMAFAAQKKLLATTDDSKIELTSLETGESIIIFQRDGYKIHHIDFSQDGGYLAASVRWEGHSFLLIWDCHQIGNTNLLNNHKLPRNETKYFKFSNENDYLVLRREKTNGDVMLFNWRSGEYVRTLENGLLIGSRCCHSFYKKTPLFAAATYSGRFCSDAYLYNIWDLETGILVKHKSIDGKLTKPYPETLSVALQPNGKHIAIGKDKQIIVWDWEKGEKIDAIMFHKDYIETILYSDDGRYLVSAGEDHDIKVWNWKTGKCLKTLQEHDSPVYNIWLSDNHLYSLGIKDNGEDETLRFIIYDARALNSTNSYAVRDAQERRQYITDTALMMNFEIILNDRTLTTPKALL